jgi:hypothetical protein
MHKNRIIFKHLLFLIKKTLPLQADFKEIYANNTAISKKRQGHDRRQE